MILLLTFAMLAIVLAITVRVHKTMIASNAILDQQKAEFYNTLLYSLLSLQLGSW